MGGKPDGRTLMIVDSTERTSLTTGSISFVWMYLRSGNGTQRSAGRPKQHAKG